MIHRTETKTTTTDIYTCERCGRENIKGATKTCPAHGEYCCYCHNEQESRYPLEICPECKIIWEEVIKRCGMGAGGELKNINPPDPFIIARNDTSGYWIGSKKTFKKLKISRATIAKPGRIIRVYE